MKKIKLLTPIVALTGLSAAVVPMVTLSSCNKNNTNKVYLAEGQTAEKTVSTLVDKVTYRFKQDNLVSPEYTKVSVADFAINGVAHSLWARTFMYRADSAGNITLTVDTGAIKNSMSGTVNEISFSLVFRNKKAGSVHYVGTFKITFDVGQIALVDTTPISKYEPEIKHLSTSFDAAKSDPFLLKVTIENEYLKGITLKTVSGKELTAGTDYSIVPLWSRTNEPYCVCLIVAINNTEDLQITDIKTTKANPSFVPGSFLENPEGESYEDWEMDWASSSKDYARARMFSQEALKLSKQQSNEISRWVYFMPSWGADPTATGAWNIPNDATFTAYDINEKDDEKKTISLSKYHFQDGYYSLSGFEKDAGQYIISVPLTRTSTNGTETTEFSFVMETFAGTTEKAEEEGTAETGGNDEEADEEDKAKEKTPIAKPEEKEVPLIWTEVK